MRSTGLQLCLALLLRSTSMFSQAGAFDPSFSGDGIQTTDLVETGDHWNDVVVLPDGNILACGWPGFILSKFNSAGMLDTTFGDNGVASLVVGFTSGAEAIAVQPDGCVVLAGFTTDGQNGVFSVFRFLPDGQPDLSFGSGGYAATPIQNSFSSSVAQDVVIQSDGKIVAAGWGYGQSVLCIVRYDVTGALDPAFSADGIAQFASDPLGATALATCLVLQPDGRIIAGGRSDDVFAAVRVQANGAPDPSFDGDGVLVTSFASMSASCEDMILQDDGRFILAGYASYSGTSDLNDFALARYNVDGSLDGSFGTGGKVVSSFAFGSSERGAAACLQPDGKVLVAGRTNNAGSTGQIGLIRYHPDGSLDDSFGTDGKVVSPFGIGGGMAYGMSLQSDGRIVVAGDSTSSHAVLVRFLNDIALGSSGLMIGQEAAFLSPNPAATTTTFTYAVSRAGACTLRLFDASGRPARTFFINASRTGGTHRSALDLSGLAAGIYTLVLSGDQAPASVKLMVE